MTHSSRFSDSHSRDVAVYSRLCRRGELNPKYKRPLERRTARGQGVSPDHSLAGLTAAFRAAFDSAADLPRLLPDLRP